MAIKASITITISKYRDCDSITRYFKLQASTAAAPAIPTTLIPSSSDWSTTEPNYTSGSTNTLYYTDKYVFSDGTFQYTDDGNGKAIKSSSYEAAKTSYNKAQNAQDTANIAISNVEEILNTTSTKEGNPIIIDDSAEKSLINFELDGKSKREVRTGKNKFDRKKVNLNSNISLDDTGIILKNIWAGIIINPEDVIKDFENDTSYIATAKIKITSKPSTLSSSNYGSFLIFYNSNTSESQVVLRDTQKESWNVGDIHTVTYSFRTPSDLTGYSLLGYTFHGNNDGSTSYSAIGTIEISELMIRKSTENNSNFELYGISPSFEYPSNIEFIGSDINLWDGIDCGLNNSTYENGTVTQIEADTASNVYWKLNYYLDNNFVDNQMYIHNSLGINRFSFIKTKLFNKISLGVNGSQRDTNIKIMVNNLIDGERYTISFNVLDVTQGKISWNNIKIQRGYLISPYSSYNKGTLLVSKFTNNLLDLKSATLSNCILNDDNTITSKINSTYFCLISTSKLNTILMNNLGEKFTFSIEETLENKYISIVVIGKRSNGLSYQEATALSSNKVTITLANDFLYIESLNLRFNRMSSVHTDTSTVVSKIQFEKLDDRSEYIEHMSDEYLLEIDPLYSYISNSKKNILKKDCITKNINEIIFDGSDDENWKIWGASLNDVERFYINIEDSYLTENIICDTFLHKSNNDNDEHCRYSVNSISNLPTEFCIFIKKSRLQTINVDGLKTYLNSHPIKLIYELQNPIDINHNEKNINILNDMETFKPKHLWFSESNMRISYFKDNGLSDIYETTSDSRKKYLDSLDKIYDLQIDQDGIRSIVGNVSDKQNVLEDNYDRLLGEFTTYKENKDSFEWNLYKTLYGDTSTQDDPRNFNDKRLTFKSMRLDDTGLSIIDSESPFSSTLNTESVQFKYYDDVVGEYNKDGASITNLKVTETSILGHLRINKVIESYGAQNPRKRTRIYWIGGQ